MGTIHQRSVAILIGLCGWAGSAAAQHAAPQNSAPPALDASSAPAPAAEEEKKWPLHRSLYLASGSLWLAGVGAKLGSGTFAFSADQHILLAEEGQAPPPQDFGALRAFTGLQYSGEALLLGSVVTLGQARYQQTKKPRSLYLASAVLMGYTLLNATNAVAIGLANDTAELPSSDAAGEANAYAGLASLGTTAFTLGQAVVVHVKQRRAEKARDEEEERAAPPKTVPRVEPSPAEAAPSVETD